MVRLTSENTILIGAVVAIIIIIGAGFFVFGGGKQSSPSTSSAPSTIASASLATTSVASTVATTATSTVTNQNTNITMVAVPTNLSQIASISTFRSCSGHDYSGYDVQGYIETNRSMKTYFQPKTQYIQKSTVPYFAPINGTIISMVPEQTFGTQIWISARGASVLQSGSYSAALAACASANVPQSQCESYCLSNPSKCGLSEGNSSANIWTIVLFHVDPLSGLKNGSSVTAGNLIGYANLSSQHNNFDMAYKTTSYNHTILDSIFNHMSPQVLSQFAKYGISQNNTILSKAYRDAKPCTCQSLFMGECIFSSSNNANGWVNLTS